MENLLDNLAIVIVLCIVLFIAYEVGKRIAAKIFGWSKDKR